MLANAGKAFQIDKSGLFEKHLIKKYSKEGSNYGIDVTRASGSQWFYITEDR